MKKLRTLGILFLVFAMILSFAACGGNETDQTPAPENSGNNEASNSPASSENSTGKRGTLNLGEYGENSYVSCFDGQSIWSMGGGMGMKNLIYDCPFYFDSKGDYQTRIFESTKWTDDTHLVCKMRDNIYFSNGDQMLGDDVLYSLELCQGTILLADWYMAVDLSQTTLSDDMLTITFCFTGPYAAYHRSLSFCILDKDYLESVGGGENIDWFDPAQVVGSGPYACTEFIPDGSSTYVLREDWWGFQYGFDVPFNRINATQYSDQTTMAIDLENGVINLALDITVQDYDRLAADSGDDLEVTTIRNNSVTSVYFNIITAASCPTPRSARRSAMLLTLTPWPGPWAAILRSMRTAFLLNRSLALSRPAMSMIRSVPSRLWQRPVFQQMNLASTWSRSHMNRTRPSARSCRGTGVRSVLVFR
jgi:ABC-type transport system substrate-binding protein